MTDRIEKRYLIIFQKLGDVQTETIRMIQQVFEDDSVGVTQIKEWFNRLKMTSHQSRQLRSKIKVMLCSFLCPWNCAPRVCPEGQTMAKEYYQQFLRRLHDAVRGKRPDLWTWKNWQLYRDSAPAH